MESATSILLNKKFRPDDDRLNYQAYVNLLLTCNVCGEAVFLKKPRDFNNSGIKRAAHFSHFKDTGKNDCWLRTESNTNTRDTDSEGKKQSLEKFQKKIQDIIDEGVINYQKKLHPQFDDRKDQRRILVDNTDKGKSLVNQYKIDINSWLSRFYEEREHIKEFAKSLYHNKLSEIQRLVFSNIVHYLCLPASEDILINILYYVFFLNKEVVLNNDFEEVRSKVIEIISFADWEKEYKLAKVSPRGFMTRRIIVTTPMLITLEASGKHWQLIGLPVRVPPYDLAVYLSNKLQPRDLINYLKRDIVTLKGKDPDSKEIDLLQSLLTKVLSGKKLDKSDILKSTQILRDYLDKAEFKHHSSYTDNYYRNYTLGYVSFIQPQETEKLTYTLTRGWDEYYPRHSKVPTVIQWLKRIPSNLRKKFGDKHPTFEQIRDYLHSTFKFSKVVELVVRKDGGIFIEIYYQGELQTKQLLNITSPVSKDPIAGKVPVKIATSIQYTGEREFYSILRCQSTDRHLIREAQKQFDRIIDNFISDTISRSAGTDKASIIAQTFKKFSLPFTLESEVSKGKLVDLKTLQIYAQHKITELVELMTKNWKNWKKREDVEIELGGHQFHKPNPGVLMMQVCTVLNKKPHLDSIVWRDLIDVFYQLSGFPIGFRCSNGVILTPYSLYDLDTERWEHRIKIQLIDLLFKDQLARQTQARKALKDAETLNYQAAIESAMNQVKQAKVGAIESWLRLSKEELYSTLEKIDPYGELKRANPDILKHLEALENTLKVS